MEYFTRHKLITLTLIIQLIALPVVLIITREPQSSQSKAALSTTIYFSPSSTITNPQNLQKGEYFSSDVIVEPGANVITKAGIEIFYDKTRVELVKSLPITINSDVFPNTQFAFSPGKIELTFSVENPEKSITEKAKVATVYFKALDNADRSIIYFGDNTKLIGINDPGLNIMQAAIPQIITISTPSAQPESTSFSNLRTTGTK